MAQASERRRNLQLQRIEHALKRLERGEFGACIECGEWIAKGRLELDPTALKCIECAE
ncbi:TraR/DksA family transcriptional regulator [Salinisphaera sp. LB1]|uniref:TraR/DksA family transcriptional regulator n=1 Tax=Salinisphaera sp. LB1 TaxID=2183911 RepID=UPI00351A4486